MAFAILLPSACSLLKSTPEETPPAAPSAREFRYLSPAMRDAILPPPSEFQGYEYADRLICRSGEHPSWKRTDKKGMVETFEVQCPSEFSETLALDTAAPPPPAPGGFRLLNEKSFPLYRDALLAAEKKDYSLMLAELDAALKTTPDESVYRRERVFALYSLGRPLEALLQAGELLKVSPSPLLFRYQAVAARQLGMKDVVLSSLDGIVSLTRPGNPLYAEAICAKGIVLTGDGDAAGLDLIKQACALEYQACCDELKNRQPIEDEPADREGTVAPEQAPTPIPEADVSDAPPKADGKSDPSNGTTAPVAPPSPGT